jgi:hypothetical protein
MAEFSIKFDKSKPHSVIYPPEQHHEKKTGAVAHFEQDGFYFTHKGHLIPEYLTEATEKKLARKTAIAVAEKKREEFLRDELSKQGIEGKDLEEAIAEVKTQGVEVKPEPGKIDLAAWARGETKLIWGQVRKAFADQYSRDVDNKPDAIDFLIEQGVIGEEFAID